MPSATDETRLSGLMQRILDLFSREGISTQTMEGIAGKIGISKRTLYKYFPGKDLLIDTVIKYKLEMLEAKILALQSSGKPYPERLQGFFLIVEDAIKPLIKKLLMDIIKNAPWIWPKIDEFRHNHVLVHLEALLAEGSDQGFIRGDLDLKIVGPLYLAIIEQIARPEFVLKQSIAPVEIVDAMVNVLLGGILSQKGRDLFKVEEKDR